ncbi:MAG: bifunctional diaminohydroxyphosphoribosylaminopyrimidine deaminase/5-amino-6-(5-phosphoribosylamino)uracil reductase RibD [Alphaproteobacteria bacterium]|nr:bifunctional diaminohydroxyphosphoribosylaminopyrimidine deaminase/5-amino-6-(5-phosphoribosylamino)uracil reductase RibD [Alphaproteobacteria bacterium]
MTAALALAARGLGRVCPNPAVGCVIAHDDRVVGRGWTQAGGRPHAETEAIGRAGQACRGATAYVTLEPCSHHGKTAPCADALIAAGIARAVVAVVDPDLRVSGSGLDRLRAAGVVVELGLMAQAAEEINAGFFSRLARGRPLVTLKVATTLDGRIATQNGSSRWITGEAARRRAHLLRSQHDAVMVGADTTIYDDPELTCRLAGLDSFSPVRIVADTHLRTPLTHKVVATAKAQPTWFVTLERTNADRKRAYRRAGVDLIEVDADPVGRPDLGAALLEIGRRGITRLLVEGGGGLAAVLVAANAVDRLAWFRAGKVAGGDGRAAILPLGIRTVAAMPLFRRLGAVDMAGDVLETYAIQP